MKVKKKEEIKKSVPIFVSLKKNINLRSFLYKFANMILPNTNFFNVNVEESL